LGALETALLFSIHLLIRFYEIFPDCRNTHSQSQAPAISVAPSAIVIRAGRRRPHPYYWEVLVELVVVLAGE